MTREEWEQQRGKPSVAQTRQAPASPSATAAAASGRDGHRLIATDEALAQILPALAPIARVAVDTEADSLHCYHEKLCLVQLSFGGNDYLVDPLAGFDLLPLSAALTG